MKYFALFLFSLSLVSVSIQAAPSSKVRAFHPLAAKVVRIETAGLVKSGSSDAFLREGWRLFDEGKWKNAMEQFLSALEITPSNQSAAEGLTMAVYRSGEVTSAVALGEEFAQSMPRIRYMIAGAVLADARQQIDRGELAALKECVKSLPRANGAYDEVRTLLEAAAWEKVDAEKGAVAQRSE